MNCPKCGLLTFPDQKFCRSCGAGLQLTTQPLVESGAVSNLTSTSAVIFRDERQRPSGLILWGFILMFIGVAIGVIGKKLMHEDIVTVVGVLISLLGMFLTVYPYLSPPKSPSRKKDDSSPSSQPEVLTPAEQPKFLPQASNTEFVPSVTERTTDLLESSAATTPRRKDDGESQA